MELFLRKKPLSKALEFTFEIDGDRYRHPLFRRELAEAIAQFVLFAEARRRGAFFAAESPARQ